MLISSEIIATFIVYASVWASWSAWSYCINNVRIRVRACNTVKGFSCFGKNQVFRVAIY